MCEISSVAFAQSIVFYSKSICNSESTYTLSLKSALAYSTNTNFYRSSAKSSYAYL